MMIWHSSWLLPWTLYPSKKYDINIILIVFSNFVNLYIYVTWSLFLGLNIILCLYLIFGKHSLILCLTLNSYMQFAEGFSEANMRNKLAEKTTKWMFEIKFSSK